MVAKRLEKGEKPYDLIFMDIFMPVMDGIEASSRITAMNTGTIISAMTANVMVSELGNYKNNGMVDFLGKPFTSQELWRILLKYLKPVSSSEISTSDLVQNDLIRKLQIYFVKNSQNKFTEITEAIEAGNIIVAHRLVHSLKGEAGQIGRTGLQKAAAEIESLLHSKKIPIPECKMNRLKIELLTVLDELKPLLDLTVIQHGSDNIDTGKTIAILEKLELMLENINPECVNMLDDIRNIPGTMELVRQIEDYDFETACQTLVELKKKLV
jgi:CheY-like chemotaxis protein